MAGRKEAADLVAGGGRNGRPGSWPPGPGVYISEKCAGTAEAVINSGWAAETALGPPTACP